MLGIENLKKVLALVLEIANVADKMSHIKDSGMAKYAVAMNLWDELAALGGVDFAQVLPEIKDLDDAEKAELYAFVKEKLAFDAEDAKLEKMVEDSIGVLIEFDALIERSIGLVKAYKA